MQDIFSCRRFSSADEKDRQQSTSVRWQIELLVDNPAHDKTDEADLGGHGSKNSLDAGWQKGAVAVDKDRRRFEEHLLAGGGWALVRGAVDPERTLAGALLVLSGWQRFLMAVQGVIGQRRLSDHEGTLGIAGLMLKNKGSRGSTRARALAGPGEVMRPNPNAAKTVSVISSWGRSLPGQPRTALRP